MSVLGVGTQCSGLTDDHWHKGGVMAARLQKMLPGTEVLDDEDMDVLTKRIARMQGRLDDLVTRLKGSIPAVELEAVLDANGKWIDKMAGRLAAQEAENARLREALGEILDFIPIHNDREAYICEKIKWAMGSEDEKPKPEDYGIEAALRGDHARD